MAIIDGSAVGVAAAIGVALKRPGPTGFRIRPSSGVVHLVMGNEPTGAVPAPQQEGGSSATVLCVLLACFAGPKRAAKIRRALDKRITGGGDAILDEVVVKIDAKHKAQTYDRAEPWQARCWDASSAASRCGR